MIQHVPTMTDTQLKERISEYERRLNLSTSDWHVYEACRAELRQRRQAAPWSCWTCDGAGEIELGNGWVRECPACDGIGSLLPEPVAP